MVHIRDVLAHITTLARAKKGRGTRKAAAGRALDLRQCRSDRSIGELDLIRTVLFVPPSMLASDLMARMQARARRWRWSSTNMAAPTGSLRWKTSSRWSSATSRTSMTRNEPLITQAGDGVYVVDAKAEIDEVAKMIGEDFAAASMANMSTRSAA